MDPDLNLSPKLIGESCQDSVQCRSNSWVNGACYASTKCQPLKHDVGSTFDSEQVLLVFVGSGFTDQATWEHEVNRVFWISFS